MEEVFLSGGGLGFLVGFLGIIRFQAFIAKCVAKSCTGALLNIGFDPFPNLLIISDAFAMHANGQEALQLFDMLQGCAELMDFGFQGFFKLQEALADAEAGMEFADVDGFG